MVHTPAELPECPRTGRRYLINMFIASLAITIIGMIHTVFKLSVKSTHVRRQFSQITELQSETSSAGRLMVAIEEQCKEPKSELVI